MNAIQDFWDGSHVGVGGHYGDPRESGRRHRGTDYAHPTNSPAPSPLNGIVVGKLAPATWHGFGYQVTIRLASGETYSFAHFNSESPLAIGQEVAVGQTIGYVGRTGATTGPCVHVEYNLGGFSDPAPHVAALVNGSAAPAAQGGGGLLTVDGDLGRLTITRWQQVMGTPADGVISPISTLVRVVQSKLNGFGYTPRLAEDGRGIAQNGSKTHTIDALQWHLGTPRDGILSRPVSGAVKALQIRLNAGTF